MNSKRVIDLEGSVAQNTNERGNDEEIVLDVRGAPWKAKCPECDGRVTQTGHESVCNDCGLVVGVTSIDTSPTLADHAPDNTDRVGEWACEPTNPLRVDKSLHTTFFLSRDGKGNTLTPKQKDKMERLRRRHKRFRMDSKRAIRLNEGLRDVGAIGSNLGVPEYVQTDAGTILRVAARERLPGGRMAWEALAGGSVLLAIRRNGLEREPSAVARYTKASEDRMCAAARKIRIQTDVEAPPVREMAVGKVLIALDDELSNVAVVRLVRVADLLMSIADREGIGPGTTRTAVAGAAVYAADRLTEGKHLTQSQVVEAASTIVPTSIHQVRSYSVELHDQGADALCQPDGAVAGLVSAD